MCSKRWTVPLGVNMSFYMLEASVGYSRATGYFKRNTGEKEERGEEAWKQRSSLLSSPKFKC